MRARRSLAGFTLIELLIVVCIIGILATLLLSGISAARKRTQVAVARNNIAALKAALQMYETDTGRFPKRPWGAGQPTGNNLFLNDIAYAYAALRNRRTALTGGGPNSPYCDWKPEQIGHVSNAIDSSWVYGKDNATSDLPAPPPVVVSGFACPIPIQEVDQINDAVYQGSPPNGNQPGGATELVFLDPWGNPYVYIEWASIPLATKDTATVICNSILMSGSGGAGYTMRPHDPSKFDIYSFGLNNVNEGGNGDDITSWTSAVK